MSELDFKLLGMLFRCYQLSIFMEINLGIEDKHRIQEGLCNDNCNQ